jgi:hypothetical protein
MSDRTILGSEFATWANARVGDTCPMCGAEIEYTPLGMKDGQSAHRVACGCTAIESKPAGVEEGDDG